MKNTRRHILLTLAALALIAATWSTLLLLKPQQQTLDQRVQHVASQLKCPVCQGESVADSSATIAQQMRQIIRKQLQSGKSEPEIIQSFQRSYGDQVIWSPPWQGFSLFAWLLPIAFFLGGAALLYLVLREWLATRPTSPSTSPTTTEPANSTLTDPELAAYRAQLENELAAEDILFRPTRTEAH